MNPRVHFDPEELDELGLWHQDIEICSTLRTKDLHSDTYHRTVKEYSNHEWLARYLDRVYGADKVNKNFLDVACNAGAHLFECQKFGGIKYGYGFDVRDMWIKQANWLKRNITSYNTNNLEFRVHGIDTMPDKLFTERYAFHVAFFDGIFYHLANPFQDLTTVASITREIITINTAYDVDAAHMKPCLIFKKESDNLEHGLTGIQGVSWLPSGPEVIIRMLKSLGFVEFRVPFKNPGTKRLCVIASKITGLINPSK